MGANRIRGFVRLIFMYNSRQITLYSLHRFEADSDDYSSIMASALADRLSEAYAEYLHHRVRTEMWGYSTHESLDLQDMLRVSLLILSPLCDHKNS